MRNFKKMGCRVGWTDLKTRFLKTDSPASQSLVAFIRARLATEGVFGIHLTIGALVLLAAGWMFGGIAEDVVTADAITMFDVQVARWFHAHATPQLTRLTLFVTHLHDPVTMLAWCTLLGLFLVWKKQWYWLLTLAVCPPVACS
jgi:undecaprenyl-diphosphatase